MNVFSYGTLMYPEIWRAVTGLESAGVEGRLHGYAVYRVRDAVFPGIIRAHGAVVCGVLYLDVDAAAVARLDRFEDDFYLREQVTIECNDGDRHEANAYVVAYAHRQVLTDEPWTRESFVASGGLDEFVAKFAGFGRVREEER